MSDLGKYFSFLPPTRRRKPFYYLWIPVTASTAAAENDPNFNHLLFT